jgi:hypothetical protein
MLPFDRFCPILRDATIYSVQRILERTARSQQSPAVTACNLA